jgi:hypothetical protein
VPVPLTAEEFDDLARPLIGLEVSLPWKGYGTAIFLELGTLTPTSYHRRDGSRSHDRGQACIGIEWDWRVETRTEVAYMTFLSITKGIPELRMAFSNGYRLRTMAMTCGDPRWRIRLPDERWLRAEEGLVHLGLGEAEGLSEEEEAVAATAEATAARWGTPRLEPAPGNCRECRFFVRLDGDFSLLSYGCCTAQEGPSSRGSRICPGKWDYVWNFWFMSV